jgi:filamentous hemagglutinin family protein
MVENAKHILFRGFVGLLIASLVIYLSPIPYAYANPVLQNPAPNAGSNIASAGNATVRTNGNVETITQTTGNAVIDWSSFNIGGKETTKFVDPNSSSLTVNRVHDMDPSQILGTLSANGNIVLINPNGVFFGKGSTVDVNGILATTSDVSNSNVMAGGKLNFTPGTNPNAAVVNQGTITAQDAGLVGLVAPNVLNSGIITAKLGKVQMSSGDSFALDFFGDGLMQIAVSDAVKQQIVQNTGTINADGGTIKLTAAAGRQIVNSLIDVEGELHAPAFLQRNGVIYIYAAGSNAVKGNVAANKGQKQGSSTVTVSGLLDATNTSGTGGNISVLGDNVGILSAAILDASGTTGGGNIKIGGDFHGAGTTPTALNTYVDPNAYIFANAMNTGNGGNVAVWSDGNTWFGGNIYARGGQQSGNGGFVETSGHGQLDADGYVDLTAPNGAKGTYLLDPATIEIYGNVTPAFNATDGSISLSSALQLWLDASDTSNVTLTYNSMGTTASGTIGTNTITVGSNSGLVLGERIQIGGSSDSFAASVNDNASSSGIYTITGISGTTITLDANLATSPSGATLYGGYVSQLTDKSGHSNNATQSTAGNMPLWISNGQNGIGITQYNGTSDYFSLPNGTVPSGTSSYSVFSSLLTTSIANRGYLGSGNYGTMDQVNAFRIDSTGVVYNYWWNDDLHSANGSVSANTNYLFGTVYNNATGRNFYIQGAQSGTGSVSTALNNSSANNTVGVTCLSANCVNGAEYWQGNIYDTIIYNTALSTNAQALINQYESAKWNIALTPPGTGGTEAAQAMASNGYSVFADTYGPSQKFCNMVLTQLA